MLLVLEIFGFVFFFFLTTAKTFKEVIENWVPVLPMVAPESTVLIRS